MHELAAPGSSGRLPVVARADEVTGWPRDVSPRFRFTIPEGWWCDVRCNPHAGAAAREVLEWFAQLGCTDGELARAERFDVAGYVGMAFPLAPPDRTRLLAKYVSLWLLWDDVEVESGESGWRLQESLLAKGQVPASFSRFDRGWWELFQELGRRRSSTWLGRLCAAMEQWAEAAVAEARTFERFKQTGQLPTFDEQLGLRVVTIGMAPTLLLLEDAQERELPLSFHELPAVERIKWLSGLLVSLGNEIFSLGKDLAEGHANLATNLVLREGLSARAAIARLIEMHDDGVRELDECAKALADEGPAVGRWIQELRYVTLGFTIWESQAPRYATHKVIAGDQVIEPVLRVDGGLGPSVLRIAVR